MYILSMRGLLIVACLWVVGCNSLHGRQKVYPSFERAVYISKLANGGVRLEWHYDSRFLAEYFTITRSLIGSEKNQNVIVGKVTRAGVGQEEKFFWLDRFGLPGPVGLYQYEVTAIGQEVEEWAMATKPSIVEPPIVQQAIYYMQTTGLRSVAIKQKFKRKIGKLQLPEEVVRQLIATEKNPLDLEKQFSSIGIQIASKGTFLLEMNHLNIWELEMPMYQFSPRVSRQEKLHFRLLGIAGGIERVYWSAHQTQRSLFELSGGPNWSIYLVK